MTGNLDRVILELEGVLGEIIPDRFRERLLLIVERYRSERLGMVITTRIDRRRAEADRERGFFTPAGGGRPPVFTWKATGSLPAILRKFRVDFIGRLGEAELRSRVYLALYLLEAKKPVQPPAAAAEPARPVVKPSAKPTVAAGAERRSRVLRREEPKAVESQSAPTSAPVVKAEKKAEAQAAGESAPARKPASAEVSRATTRMASSAPRAEATTGGSGVGATSRRSAERPTAPKAETRAREARAGAAPARHERPPRGQSIMPAKRSQAEALQVEQAEPVAEPPMPPQAARIIDVSVQALPAEEPAPAPTKRTAPAIEQEEMALDGPAVMPIEAPRPKRSERSARREASAQKPARQPASEHGAAEPRRESQDTEPLRTAGIEGGEAPATAPIEAPDGVIESEEKPNSVVPAPTPVGRPAAAEPSVTSPAPQMPALQTPATQPAAPQPAAPQLAAASSTSAPSAPPPPAAQPAPRPAPTPGQIVRAPAPGGRALKLPGNFYQEFFGFDYMPFNNTPDSRFYFPTEKHQEALSRMIYVISERKGFVMISGEIGSGKSTLCRTLLARLPREVKTALITHTHLDSTQIVHAIAEDLGLKPEGKDRFDTIRLINEYLIEQHRKGCTVCIIIDEAQNLTSETLEEIRMISNLETEEEKLVQLLLLGQPELRDKMRRPEMQQLRERIAVQFHLEPLTLKETIQYIQHRLRLATPRKGLEFPRSALEEVYRFSGGVPRLINGICDNVLLTLYTRQLRKATVGIIREAARDMNLEPRVGAIKRIFGR